MDPIEDGELLASFVHIYPGGLLGVVYLAAPRISLGGDALLPSTYRLYVVERLGVRVAAQEDDGGYQTIDAFTTITT